MIKKVPILQDITVTFESGKIYGLKGKNGSGKTMLMRAISGLIIPNSGTINIDGEILGKDISFPRSIGILIENPSFLGNYTGYKNLEMLASIQNRIGEDEIRETLAEVGLDPDDNLLSDEIYHIAEGKITGHEVAEHNENTENQKKAES